jgi:hypothetical protein
MYNYFFLALYILQNLHNMDNNRGSHGCRNVEGICNAAFLLANKYLQHTPTFRYWSMYTFTVIGECILDIIW